MKFFLHSGYPSGTLCSKKFQTMLILAFETNSALSCQNGLFLRFSSHSDFLYFIVPSYKESPICLILLPELDRCNDQTFVSFLITVWKTAAKDRSLACFACTRILLLFLKVFSPFFPILQLLWLDTLIKWIEARKKQELHHTRLFHI